MASKVVLIFVDGLGVGIKDPTVNPCAAPGVRFLNNFLDAPRTAPIPFGGLPLTVDVSMGVPGIPQSATGQTALLTGINAAHLVGRHKEGFPNRILREVLLKHSILKTLAEAGFKPTFLNAYRPRFFEFDVERRLKLSATTVANLAAGLPFYSLEDVRKGRALYQEFTNRSLIARGFDVSPYRASDAGTILAERSGLFDFTLFEYFQTDRAGHSRNLDIALAEIHKVEQFLQAFLSAIRLADTTVLLTGEHGNIEDMSVKTHTMNPAMGIVWGESAAKFKEQIRSLEDVVPAIKGHFLKGKKEGRPGRESA